jgi:diguanylate cyclase (GGDEF)-like protein
MLSLAHLPSIMLYRVYGAGLLLCVLLAGGLSLPAVPPWQTGLAVCLSLGLIAGHEAMFRLIRRWRESEPAMAEKLHAIMAIASVLGAGVLFLLMAGPVSLMLMALVPMLLVQLIGHKKLGLVLMGAATLVLGLSIPLGLLHAPASPLAFGLSLLPFMAVLTLVGIEVGNSVRLITHQVSRLQSLAATDVLTGLINRRQFNNRLIGEIARATRHNSPLSLALFDIDNFKKINDIYGHPVGDRILKELGSLVSKNIRESDVAARYGGEEFALILPETRLLEAYELLERIRALIERHVFCMPDNPLTLSLSIGVAQLDPESHTSYEFVEQADTALYEAKRQGKNRVILFGIGMTPKAILPTRS